uniref:Uncharacterized protein n=1 Tax=Roseihalotalea indica TaxID=2867963 RepID=A0AA49JFL2_9BACT|nr:hypothetical protein K4G66_08045 [Tunicatimonas sp. TK19036]
MKKYSHSLIEVKGVYSIQHARRIEEKLKVLKGVLQAAVSVSGMVGIEFETARINEAIILKSLKNDGLVIINPEVSVEIY